MQNHPTLWRSELRRGLRAQTLGDFSRARRHFERAHRHAPERAETCLALGKERWRQGDLEDAEHLLEAAFLSAPDLLSARLTLARFCAFERGTFARAYGLLDGAQNVAHATVALVRAELLLEEGRLPEAEAIASPLQLAAESSEKAAAELVMARVENARGLALVDKGSFDTAVFAFKRASDLDPSWATPLSNLGAAFEALHRFERAEAAYTAATQIEPSYACGWHNLARLQARGQSPRAAQSFQRAHDCEPGNSDLAAACARHLAPTFPDQARLVLHRCARCNGDTSDAWIELGKRLAGYRELDLTEFCFRRAHRLAGNDATKQKLASLLAHKGKWPQALKLSLVDDSPPG